jgi:hypothetical protein
MKNESLITKIVNGIKRSDISNELIYVNDILDQYQNLLSMSFDIFEELDKKHDKIEEMRFLGNAPETFAKLTDTLFEQVFFTLKCKNLAKILKEEPEVRYIAEFVNKEYKYDKKAQSYGLKFNDDNRIIASNILYNYNTLLEIKNRLESSLKLMK